MIILHLQCSSGDITKRLTYNYPDDLVAANDAFNIYETSQTSGIIFENDKQECIVNYIVTGHRKLWRKDERTD